MSSPSQPATVPSRSPSAKPTRSRFPAWLRVVLIALLVAGSLYYALQDVRWRDVESAIGRADPWWILGVALVVMLAHLARAERWRDIIPGEPRVGLLNAFSATLIGYFMNNLIPRAGEFVRPYTLARRENRSMSALLATVAVERILDGLTLLVILLGILLLIEDDLPHLMNQIDLLKGMEPDDLIVKLGLPIAALIIGLILVIATPLGDRLVGVAERRLPEKIGGKIRGLFDEFRAGARFSGGILGGARVLFWSIVIWAAYALSLHCGVIAFAFDKRYGLNVGDSVVILGITAIGMAIAPTPGGFGVFHAFCRATLLTLYGIPANEAVAFALLTHFAQYMAAMIGGLFFGMREGLGGLFRSRRTTQEG